MNTDKYPELEEHVRYVDIDYDEFSKYSRDELIDMYVAVHNGYTDYRSHYRKQLDIESIYFRRIRECIGELSINRALSMCVVICIVFSGIAKVFLPDIDRFIIFSPSLIGAVIVLLGSVWGVNNLEKNIDALNAELEDKLSKAQFKKSSDIDLEVINWRKDD